MQQGTLKCTCVGITPILLKRDTQILTPVFFVHKTDFKVPLVLKKYETEKTYTSLTSLIWILESFCFIHCVFVFFNF